jgi:hypothetical protein
MVIRCWSELELVFEGYVVLFNGFVMLHDDGEKRLNCVSLKK